MKDHFQKISLISLIILLFTTGTASAATYVLGYSAVDSGKGMEWGGSTTYSTEWNSGIATWNAKGKVKIAADTASTWQDLTVSDVNSTAGAWYGVVGLYTYKSGITADKIQFNKAYMAGYAVANRQNATTHELGHALGLAHSVANNVMYSSNTTRTTLGTQDSSDYSYLYP